MQQPLRNRAGGAAHLYPSTTTDETTPTGSDTDNNINYSSTNSHDGTMDLNSSNQFESLKREATKLERQLEEKVAKYQQVSPPPSFVSSSIHSIPLFVNVACEPGWKYLELILVHAE